MSSGQHFDLDLEHEEVDSVSGLVLARLGRPPVVGDIVEYGRIRLEVTATSGRGVQEARASVLPPAKQERNGQHESDDRETSMTARNVATVMRSGGFDRGAVAQAPPRSGIDQAQFDHRFAPQDDFFRHVNGAWLARTEIPADRATYGTFVELSDRTETDLRALVEALAARTRTDGRDRRRNRSATCTRPSWTRPALDRLGAAPLAASLAQIDAINVHHGPGDRRSAGCRWPACRAR